MLAAAALSSIIAAFCWVTWSIWVTAWPTWVTPRLCSALAVLISAMIWLTCWIELTMASIVRLASSTSAVPWWTCSTLPVTRVLISLAALALRCARLRTSLATTAKPAALLARPGGFDRGVQRQDVGLEGDAVESPR